MAPVREILLVAHTHHDVGYTNSPRIIDGMHARIVSRVLDLCDEHPAAGPAQFKWTFEAARPVLNFVRTAGGADIERLRNLVAEGRISVTGGYLNMTQLPSDGEFDVAYDQVQRLIELGIPVRTQQNGDVNGLAWGVVSGMRRAGITRLLMALNPDHGRPPFAQPTGFWWKGPSGDRVFTWLSTHYGFGEEWGILDADLASAETNILGYIERLGERRDYPYSMAVVHAANDNRWPTAEFLEVVRHWNTEHPDIPMRTATVDEALDALEAEAAGIEIPVVSGEWSDWWSHGHGSTAREVAVYREARSFSRAAQATLGLSVLCGSREPELATVLGYRRGPVRVRSEHEVVADLDHVDEQLLLFAEHTWGSWETYSKPHSTFSYSHWNAKAGFAYEAYDYSRDLAIEGFFRFAARDPHRGPHAKAPNVILVVNPTERERTEAVAVEVDGARRARTLATVPAFGSAVVPVPAPPRPREAGTSIHTDRYLLVVDPTAGGIVSLVDQGTGRELVDPGVAHGVAAVVAETVAADSSHPMVVRSPKDFHPDNPGPDFLRCAAAGQAMPTIQETDDLVQITWDSHLEGLLTATTTVTLYHHLDAIDVDVSIAKPEAFGPESIFVAFPFAINEPEFLLETAGAVYAAGSEQLPDTSKDWYSIQHAVGVSNATAGILWGSLDAPLVQVGGFHTGQWARDLDVEGGHINSWLMNNLHFTNFQARQEGTRTYRYRFTPHARPVSRNEVRIFGRNLLEPLQARQYSGNPVATGGGGLRVTPADSILAELRPIGGGDVRVRLRNIEADPVTASVEWTDDTVEGGGNVALAGHGVADVVLRRVR